MFDKIDLKSGDLIEIKGKVYEIIYIRKELAPYRKTQPIREYLAIYLHDNKHNMLTPTHVLKYYPDTKDIYLVSLIVEKLKNEEIKLDIKK